MSAPIIRRRRTGVYSVCERATDALIGSVEKRHNGWWIAYDARGSRIGPGGSGYPALYGTRRGAVSDLLIAAAPESGDGQ